LFVVIWRKLQGRAHASPQGLHVPATRRLHRSHHDLSQRACATSRFFLLNANAKDCSCCCCCCCCCCCGISPAHLQATSAAQAQTAASHRHSCCTALSTRWTNSCLSTWLASPRTSRFAVFLSFSFCLLWRRRVCGVLSVRFSAVVVRSRLFRPECAWVRAYFCAVESRRTRAAGRRLRSRTACSSTGSCACTTVCLPTPTPMVRMKTRTKTRPAPRWSVWARSLQFWSQVAPTAARWLWRRLSRASSTERE
jgi:hypothetical protein